VPAIVNRDDSVSTEKHLKTNPDRLIETKGKRVSQPRDKMSNKGDLSDKKTHSSHIFYQRKMRLWRKSHAGGLHLDTLDLGL